MVEKFVLTLFINDKEKRSCSFTRTELTLLMYGLGYAKKKIIMDQEKFYTLKFIKK